MYLQHSMAPSYSRFMNKLHSHYKTMCSNYLWVFCRRMLCRAIRDRTSTSHLRFRSPHNHTRAHLYPSWCSPRLFYPTTAMFLMQNNRNSGHYYFHLVCQITVWLCSCYLPCLLSRCIWRVNQETKIKDIWLTQLILKQWFCASKYFGLVMCNVVRYTAVH